MSNEKFPGQIEITLKTAESWVKKHRQDTTIEDPKKKISGYLIPRESLEKVLALNTTAVRAYIGKNDDNEQTLLFVGAEHVKDDYYKDVFPEVISAEKGEAASGVYDGTRTNPPYDDPSSPLNP